MLGKTESQIWIWKLGLCVQSDFVFQREKGQQPVPMDRLPILSRVMLSRPEGT